MPPKHLLVDALYFSMRYLLIDAFSDSSPSDQVAVSLSHGAAKIVRHTVPFFRLPARREAGWQHYSTSSDATRMRHLTPITLPDNIRQPCRCVPPGTRTGHGGGAATMCSLSRGAPARHGPSTAMAAMTHSKRPRGGSDARWCRLAPARRFPERPQRFAASHDRHRGRDALLLTTGFRPATLTGCPEASQREGWRRWPGTTDPPPTRRGGPPAPRGPRAGVCG